MANGHFSIFKDGGRRHLGFSKGGNFRGGKGQEGQSASPSQILRRSGKPLLRYGHLKNLKMAAAAILDFRNLGILGVQRVKRVKMHH